MTAEKRSDLAAFLRTRRERITPEMVELAPGPRRRTPGLRREEVAQLAGVGVTWYTWLEQGRPINASLQVLDAIARTLLLDNAERQHLYRLAGQPELTPPHDSKLVTDEMQAILDQLGEMPAMINTSRYDVLAWNAAYAALFPEMLETEDEVRNTLWQTFVQTSWKTQLVNREQELPRAVAVFRGAYSRHASDPCWQDFARRLALASPEFARLWARQDVADPGPRVKIFKHEVVGELRFATTSFHCSAAPETRMVVYSFADDRTRTSTQWLMSHH